MRSRKDHAAHSSVIIFRNERIDGGVRGPERKIKGNRYRPGQDRKKHHVLVELLATQRGLKRKRGHSNYGISRAKKASEECAGPGVRAEREDDGEYRAHQDNGPREQPSDVIWHTRFLRDVGAG